MSNKEFFEGKKKFISSKEAGNIFGYTGDYVARLARQRKVNAKMIGKTWYIEEDAFKKFLAEKNKTREVQKQVLSQKLKEEYKDSSGVKKEKVKFEDLTQEEKELVESLRPKMPFRDSFKKIKNSAFLGTSSIFERFYLKAKNLFYNPNTQQAFNSMMLKTAFGADLYKKLGALSISLALVLGSYYTFSSPVFAKFALNGTKKIGEVIEVNYSKVASVISEGVSGLKEKGEGESIFASSKKREKISYEGVLTDPKETFQKVYKVSSDFYSDLRYEKEVEKDLKERLSIENKKNGKISHDIKKDVALFYSELKGFGKDVVLKTKKALVEGVQDARNIEDFDLKKMPEPLSVEQILEKGKVVFLEGASRFSYSRNFSRFQDIRLVDARESQLDKNKEIKTINEIAENAKDALFSFINDPEKVLEPVVAVSSFAFDSFNKTQNIGESALLAYEKAIRGVGEESYKTGSLALNSVKETTNKAKKEYEKMATALNTEISGAFSKADSLLEKIRKTTDSGLLAFGKEVEQKAFTVSSKTKKIASDSLEVAKEIGSKTLNFTNKITKKASLFASGALSGADEAAKDIKNSNALSYITNIGKTQTAAAEDAGFFSKVGSFFSKIASFFTGGEDKYASSEMTSNKFALDTGFDLGGGAGFDLGGFGTQTSINEGRLVVRSSFGVDGDIEVGQGARIT